MVESFQERAEQLKRSSLAILERNRRVTDGRQYTVPSPSTYPYQWLWDSCFHAIALSHLSPSDARREIDSLVSKQFDNGMVPHMVYWQRDPQLEADPGPSSSEHPPRGAVNIDWGKEGTSSITQPPLLAQVVLQICEHEKDFAWAKELYPHLYHYYNYLLNERDPRRHNLVGIINPDESGEDNSPRFDAPLGLPPKQTIKDSLQSRMKLVQDLRACNFDAPFCMKNYFWVKDVPFNSIFVKNLRALSRLSEHLGFADEAVIFQREADAVAQAMRVRMQEDGVFWSLYGSEYTKIKIKTWAIFAPLFASILSPDEARSLVDTYLLEPKQFRTAYFVPSVALSEETYDPEGFWRGPVWLSVNWFVFHGLMNYGFTPVAERVLESSMQLLERSGFREYFNPETGEGYGADEFTWGVLVVDMLERWRKEAGE